MVTISVYQLIGKSAISMSSGDKVYQLIYQNLKTQEDIVLDFNGVVYFASPFFNASIGRLLKDLSIDDLLQKVQMKHLDPVGKNLLNLSIANALKIFKRD
ncbi:STAS-like domain-containing protein [Acinetobacter rudis]|uniref:STAS-like domain-containing protein n=1 Tax=Acinetobacter rudis TaxID=632955 RepID=UPI00333FEAEF